MNLPFLYRVHEYPKEEKIQSYLSFISSLGYSVPGNIKDISPKSMQSLLLFLKDKPEFKILSSQLLRSMQKAIYLPQNLGHYGLASQCYTHFTSPIRRYPDTTVHRLLRTYLFKKDMSRETINRWEQKLVYIADHSSERERASVDCEREVDDMKMAEYMESHIGEQFEGMVSTVTNFGLFVQLDNLIEGLVHITDLNGFYNYDEVSQTLRAEKNDDKYTLGDRVLVEVIRASKEERAVDFRIIKRL
jgi:ribonuclease R